MKLASFIPKDSSEIRIGAIFDEKESLVDLNVAYSFYLKDVERKPQAQKIADALMPKDMLSFIDGGQKNLDRMKKTVDYVNNLRAKNEDLKERNIIYEMSEIQLKSPIPRPRGVGIGYFNTKGIIEEASRAGKESEGISTDVIYPTQATISWSHPRCVIGPDEPIIFPKMSKTVFNSIELGLVVGKEAYQVPKDKAQQYIFGYTVTTDLTAFDLVQSEPFVYTVCRCKSMPTFWPTGPWIVLPDQIGDVHNLDAIVRINGEQEMKANTRDYTFDPIDHINHISQYMILEAGTVIAMGAFSETTFTFINPGDVVENEIEGIGTLRNPVITEDEARKSGLM